MALSFRWLYTGCMFDYTFRSGSAPQFCDYQVQYCRDCVEARDDCGTAAMSPTCEQFCKGKITLFMSPSLTMTLSNQKL